MRGARPRGARLWRDLGIIPAYAGSTASVPEVRRAPRDHPRVCGEHDLKRSAPRTCVGSSPRMRGAHVPTSGAHVPHGIIPAYAGSTARPRRTKSRRWDHPRVCGEHSSCEGSPNFTLGSSPRMRGALGVVGHVDHGLGIIPAYAGSTYPMSPPPTLRQDHPRVCGEHNSLCWTGSRRSGSSPRMRGARLGGDGALHLDGIIPAYAGSTCGTETPCSSREDHPRVCGEHAYPGCAEKSPSGSSPRMRGARGLAVLLDVVCGIIPAYAGSTPRMSPRKRPAQGSSPRMRGARVLSACLRHRAGIIPAYAGSTVRQSRSGFRRTDHPRVCGEHPAAGSADKGSVGSSPRMRGALYCRRNYVAREGIIPAYAGSTRQGLRH